MADDTPRTPSDTPLVALRGIWKVFESVTVLRGIDFDIHIEVSGEAQSYSRPSEAHAKGIYMVPQEPQIFPNLSVRENLLLGLAGDPADNARRAREIAEEIGLATDFATPGGELSIANQQLVEIVRGLLRNAKVLILDEPTSSLTRREVASLARQMRALTARGIGILFISHRLDEVIELSDRVSVLRDGHFVLEAGTDTLTTEALVEAMLPADFTAPAPEERAARPRDAGAKPVLEVRGLSSLVFRDVSFEVYPGEVVGISGVVGAGRTELAQAVFGIDTGATGEVVIDGSPAPKRSPQICQSMGLSYVPEDRHAHGIFLDLPSAHTISASLMALGRSRFMSEAQERELAGGFVERLRIKLASAMQYARTLSGGNQQKIVLAKTLAPAPRVVILDEPTRGIDAHARQDVYRIIRSLTADGVGVVVISSEVGEIAEVSDRIMVMKRGTLVELPAHVRSVEQISAAIFDSHEGARSRVQDGVRNGAGNGADHEVTA
ncbi:MAG: ABC transporter [Rhodobacterales bacterium]|nr:MAG: ABC transporter [Rhodobacterales bacterium]